MLKRMVAELMLGLLDDEEVRDELLAKMQDKTLEFTTKYPKRRARLAKYSFEILCEYLGQHPKMREDFVKKILGEKRYSLLCFLEEHEAEFRHLIWQMGYTRRSPKQ